jgi:hypothetical protein
MEDVTGADGPQRASEAVAIGSRKHARNEVCAAHGNTPGKTTCFPGGMLSQRSNTFENIARKSEQEMSKKLANIELGNPRLVSLCGRIGKISTARDCQITCLTSDR